MLRMPPFGLLQPTSVEEALAMLRAHPGAVRLAGGTDLLPALKSGKVAASTVVGLDGVEALRGVTADGAGALRIGALTTLHRLQRDPAVRTLAPALAEAAGHAASPQIRRQATLGGNLLLDVRCRYVDQSALFRHALGGCLKSHGVECHVVPGGRTCVAALCADTVAPLVALGAEVEIAGATGTRQLPLAALYGPDGRTPHAVAQDELLVAVTVPAQPVGRVVVGRRWALRRAIDFPLLSLAVAVTLRPDGAGMATIVDGEVVVTTLGPQPRISSLAAWAGQRWEAATQAEVVAFVGKRSRAMPNLPFDAAYRQQRLEVELARLLAQVAAPTADSDGDPPARRTDGGAGPASARRQRPSA